MGTPLRFHQLDVFSATPLLGNALAVVHDAHALSDEDMAAFARWTNLSETTFLLPPRSPDADYHVRIFTPEGELPFAGHPTLGSCHAWLLAGGKPRLPGFVVQECGVGLVRIRRDGNRLAFAAPPRKRTGPLDTQTLDHVCASLGISPADIRRHQWVDNGPGWCALLFDSANLVLGLKPNFAQLKVPLGVIAPQSPGADTDFEVRAFVPSLGVPEDPVTGSLNAALAQWLMEEKIAGDHYTVSQGTVLFRKGRVYLDRVDGEIWVGGEVVVCVEGTVTLK